jgi:hypothetical protein
VLCCIAAADAGDWLAKEGSCSHAYAITMMASVAYCETVCNCAVLQMLVDWMAKEGIVQPCLCHSHVGNVLRAYCVEAVCNCAVLHRCCRCW